MKKTISLLMLAVIAGSCQTSKITQCDFPELDLWERDDFTESIDWDLWGPDSIPITNGSDSISYFTVKPDPESYIDWLPSIAFNVPTAEIISINTLQTTTIAFSLLDSIILKFDVNGDVFYRGQLIENDGEILQGLREYLNYDEKENDLLGFANYCLEIHKKITEPNKKDIQNYRDNGGWKYYEKHINEAKLESIKKRLK